jgi:hypothetical protein
VCRVCVCVGLKRCTVPLHTAQRKKGALAQSGDKEGDNRRGTSPRRLYRAGRVHPCPYKMQMGCGGGRRQRRAGGGGT